LQLLNQQSIDHETLYERCVDGGYPNAVVFNILLSVITACEVGLALLVHEMLYSCRAPRNSQLFVKAVVSYTRTLWPQENILLFSA